MGREHRRCVRIESGPAFSSIFKVPVLDSKIRLDFPLKSLGVEELDWVPSRLVCVMDGSVNVDINSKNQEFRFTYPEHR